MGADWDSLGWWRALLVITFLPKAGTYSERPGFLYDQRHV